MVNVCACIIQAWDEPKIVLLDSLAASSQNLRETSSDFQVFYVMSQKKRKFQSNYANL